MKVRLRVVAALIAAVIAAAGVFFLVRTVQQKQVAHRLVKGANPAMIVTEAPPSPQPVGVRPSSGGSAGDARTVARAPVPAPVPVPTRPRIPGEAASPGQVDEAFIAMSAARLCAVRQRAYRTTSDLENQAASAADVALTSAQATALAKRMATDPAFAQKVAARFKATCSGG